MDLIYHLSGLIFILVVLLAFLALGYWFRSRNAGHKDESSEQAMLVKTTLFGLLGLILAFTFSTAWSRYDARLGQSINEANAIGTAVLRLDLLPPEERKVCRTLIQDFVEERLEFNKSLREFSTPKSPKRRHEIEGNIWKTAIGALAKPKMDVYAVPVLNPINEMFDHAARRDVETKIAIPGFVFVLLVGLSSLCAYLAGREMAMIDRKAAVLGLLFIGCVGLTVYTALDLANPRAGFIRIDEADALLTELRDSLK